MVAADITQPNSLQCLIEAKPNMLVYCVAASEQSDASYLQHYVLGLHNTLQLCRQMQTPPHLLFISSTRMYGQDSLQALDESSPTLQYDYGGQRLLEAEQLLQDYAHARVLRLTGIYGPGRQRMLQLARQPERWPEENKWSNRIHRDDAAGFILHLCQMLQAGQSCAPCYIVTDDMPAPMHEVLSYLAQQQQLTVTPSHTPVTGRYFSNHLMRQTGYQLRYPNYRSGGYALADHASDV